MPYNIEQIDELFPVAGVDNESQGFRDNFSNIKQSLAQAKTDIENLQSNSLDKTDLESNLNGNTVKNINIGNVSYDAFSLTGVNNNATEGQPIDYQNGPYQGFAVNKTSPGPNNPQVFSFENWPEIGRYGSLRVQITSQLGTTQYFSFIYPSGLNFFYDSSWPRTDDEVDSVLSVTSTNAKIFEFWTTDAGNNIFARYIGEYELVAS